MLAGGCSLATPPPQARVRLGPAFDQPPGRILALATECRTAEEDTCNLGHQLAVAAEARMSLEFVGHRIIDSETVNLHANRAPVGAVPDPTASPEATQKQTILWDLKEIQKYSALLLSMGIDGYLYSRISVGPPRKMAQQRTVAVEISVARVADQAMAWRSTCRVETGDYYSLDQAVELAARCALDSATTVEVP